MRPKTEFRSFFENLLPRRETVKRPRTEGTADILVGEIQWKDGVNKGSARIEIWPVLNNCSMECRIAKINRWSADREDD